MFPMNAHGDQGQLVAFEGFICLGFGPVGAEVGGDVIVLVRDPL